MQLLQEVVSDLNQSMGEEARGTVDLTQDEFQAAVSLE